MAGPEDLSWGALLQEVVPPVLEAGTQNALGAAKGERTETRAGKLEWRVRPTRQGRFRTEVFGRHQRSGM